VMDVNGLKSVRTTDHGEMFFSLTVKPIHERLSFLSPMKWGNRKRGDKDSPLCEKMLPFYSSNSCTAREEY